MTKKKSAKQVIKLDAEIIERMNVVVFRIVEQTRRGKRFGIDGVFQSGSTFLRSVSFPEFNGPSEYTFYVWGDSKDKDGTVSVVSVSRFDMITKAIEDFNWIFSGEKKESKELGKLVRCDRKAGKK